MRIGIFTDTYPPYINGVSTSIKMLENALRKKGHKVYVITVNPKNLKYIIEENEDGFFIVNVRTQKRMLLTKLKTTRGGVIIVNKESDKKSFTIVKTLSASTLHTSMSRIIGTLKIEGLLLKFTAFDKTIINTTVTV